MMRPGCWLSTRQNGVVGLRNRSSRFPNLECVRLDMLESLTIGLDTLRWNAARGDRSDANTFKSCQPDKVFDLVRTAFGGRKSGRVPDLSADTEKCPVTVM